MAKERGTTSTNGEKPARTTVRPSGSANDTQKVDTGKVKRPVGRPKKVKTDEQKKAEAGKVKRPRGRPKKIKTDDEKRVDELVANAFVPSRKGSATKGGLTRTRAKQVFSKKSVDRLKELDFDPMLAMVNLFYEVCEYIHDMQSPDSKRKFSPHALAALVATKQKLVNDLMRYGYSHVAEDKAQDFGGNLIEVVLTEENAVYTEKDIVRRIESPEIIEDNT